jgi:hypothetical protein
VLRSQQALDDLHDNDPLSGVVLSLEVAPGAQVGAGSPVFTLLEAGQMEFHTTNLSERDLALIRPGQKACQDPTGFPCPPAGHPGRQALPACLPSDVEDLSGLTISVCFSFVWFGPFVVFVLVRTSRR